ncbi:hypothetical protein ASD55_01090 [Rhodanobacter sp. Root561]|jgi:hypothetical protein|uniref:hypothetical protein n=1 Tax=Rhodanobacter sp. Root561 TaxID=1736560 RepID=UPI0006F58F06|nr:hypothetical protein [Rhodanobacter sp. Root561]KQZ79343.1 hypothetical protein ASD55_01090 [Rhodanobacter sp. Root561]
MPVNTPTLLRTRPTLDANEACVTFVAAAQLMLDPATPEALRREVEPRLLAQLPTLRALGVFDLFELRDPALRAWLADELAELGGGGVRT